MKTENIGYTIIGDHYELKFTLVTVSKIWSSQQQQQQSLCNENLNVLYVVWWSESANSTLLDDTFEKAAATVNKKHLAFSNILSVLQVLGGNVLKD